MLSGLERAIVAAVGRAVAQGLQPKSLYLTRDDYRALERPYVDDMPVHMRKGAGRSAVACKRGILCTVRKRDR